MTKRLQILLAWYLALSFIFAGLIAISPALHQGIEHAGQGVTHIHYAGAIQGGAAGQDKDGPGGATVKELAKVSLPSVDLDPNHPIFRHRHGFDLPDFGKLWALASKALQETGTSSSTDRSAEHVPDHEHNSLSELLARGLLEQPLDLPLFEIVRAPIVSRCEFAEPILYLQDWNAQTATRGPPSALS